MEIDVKLNFLEHEAYELNRTLQFSDENDPAVSTIEKRLQEIYTQMEKLERKQVRLAKKILKTNS